MGNNKGQKGSFRKDHKKANRNRKASDLIDDLKKEIVKKDSKKDVPEKYNK